jgi:hypothetical protein
VIATAAAFAVDGRARPYARLGFASLDRDALVEGVRRLAAARPLRGGPGSASAGAGRGRRRRASSGNW